MSVQLSEHTRFEELVLPHLDAGYNLARWLTRDVHDAEDVVQDACMRALKYVGTLRDGDARAWFLTIVRHAFYDWCRRNRPAEILKDDGTAIDMAVDDSAIDPEQAALRSAESRVLADAVARAAAGFSGGTGFARTRGAFVQGNRAHRRHPRRHGDVAARARPRPAATLAAVAFDPRTNVRR